MTSQRITALHVCSSISSAYGAVANMMTLARGLHENGHRVIFVGFAGKQMGGELREFGFEAVDIRVRAKIDPIAIREIAQLARKEGADLIHTHLSTSSVIGTLAARWAGLPSVSTVHGASNKWSYNLASRMVAVSQHVKDHLVGQGVPPEKVVVVRNGIVPFAGDELIDKQCARANLGLGVDDRVVATFARVKTAKGFADSLNAIASLDDVVYLVAGNGPDFARYQQMAADLGIADRVRFLGYRSDVAPILRAADVFLLPSHSEALGIALLEALSAETPVVATNIGGIPEVVTDECGLLVSPHSPDQIAAALATLLDNPDLRARMGATGRQRVDEMFSVKKMAAEMETVYRSLISIPAMAGEAVP